MARRYNYEIGDFVKYEGNLSILTRILRDPDFGRIELFETHHNSERIYLYLLKKRQHIWCDFRDIRQILTKPEHLRALNFQTIDVNGRKKYELGNITISGTLISTPATTYLFQYCIGDFTNGILDVDNYMNNGELNLSRFLTDYPDVTNLNDLLNFLEIEGQEIEKRTSCKQLTTGNRAG